MSLTYLADPTPRSVHMYPSPPPPFLVGNLTEITFHPVIELQRVLSVLIAFKFMSSLLIWPGLVNSNTIFWREIWGRKSEPLHQYTRIAREDLCCSWWDIFEINPPPWAVIEIRVYCRIIEIVHLLLKRNWGKYYVVVYIGSAHGVF